MEDFDVVVLGTGAAGLLAAIRAHDGGARVGVFEKADEIGGTSAWSGGMLWIPNNPHMAELGIDDSPEEALEYIMSLSLGGMIDEELARAFVDAGPEMIRWTEENTPVDFVIVEGFPDYHPEFPSGKTEGGRSMECPLFDFKQLGGWADKVRRSYFFQLPLTMTESTIGGGVFGEVSQEEIDRRIAANEWGCGRSLVGRLLKGCLDRGIEPVTEARAVQLVVDDGGIKGVKFEGRDGPFEVSARGAILATGGFEWDTGLVKDFLRGPMTAPVSVPTNTGDGLRMAMRAGSALGNMREAWWTATVEIPGDRGDGHTMQYIYQGERCRPGAILVNRSGRRFVNEAANYNAFGAAFHVQDVTRFEYSNLPCWSVFDQACVDTYGHVRTAPGEPVLDFVMRAETVGELAEQIGVPADVLEDTIARWNADVAQGRDSEFGRGDSAQDRWWGDATKAGSAAATLGPISKPPFYAVEVHSGALGTKGGPKTDGDGRVLDIDGEPITGLYAAGNVMASPMGATYGGAGGTLGPAMTFGYLAGRHSAEQAKLRRNR